MGHTISTPFVAYCLQLPDNPVFLELVRRFDIFCPVEWICLYFVVVKGLYNILHKTGHRLKALINSKTQRLPEKLEQFMFVPKIAVDELVKATPSTIQVMVFTGKVEPPLPRNNNQSSNAYGPTLPSMMDTKQPGSYGPALPTSIGNYGPALPSSTGMYGPRPAAPTSYGPAIPLGNSYGPRPPAPTSNYGPALPSSASSYGPALPSSRPHPPMNLGPALPPMLNALVSDISRFGPRLPENQGYSYGPGLPRRPAAPAFSSFPSEAIKDVSKFGPPLPDSTVEAANPYGPPIPNFKPNKKKRLPDVAENCHTSIERLMKLYNFEPEIIEGSKTSLQLVFGGNSQGFDPDQVEPKIISNSLVIHPPKPPPVPEKEKVTAVSLNPMHDPIVNTLLSSFPSFRPPTFKSFPKDSVADAIVGKTDEHKREREPEIERAHNDRVHEREHHSHDRGHDRDHHDRGHDRERDRDRHHDHRSKHSRSSDHDHERRRSGSDRDRRHKDESSRRNPDLPSPTPSIGLSPILSYPQGMPLPPAGMMQPMANIHGPQMPPPGNMQPMPNSHPPMMPPQNNMQPMPNNFGPRMSHMHDGNMFGPRMPDMLGPGMPTVPNEMFGPRPPGNMNMPHPNGHFPNRPPDNMHPGNILNVMNPHHGPPGIMGLPGPDMPGNFMPPRGPDNFGRFPQSQGMPFIPRNFQGQMR